MNELEKYKKAFNELCEMIDEDRLYNPEMDCDTCPVFKSENGCERWRGGFCSDHIKKHFGLK